MKITQTRIEHHKSRQKKREGAFILLIIAICLVMLLNSEAIKSAVSEYRQEFEIEMKKEADKRTMENNLVRVKIEAKRRELKREVWTFEQELSKILQKETMSHAEKERVFYLNKLIPKMIAEQGEVLRILEDQLRE